MATRTEPTYFSSAAAFQRWLNENSASSHELIVGFKKRRTSDPGMSWPEAVDEALCVGWVDGVRRRIDGERYQIRFTCRRPGSTWSALNIARVAFLQQQGRMKPAGLAAFANRAGQESLAYSYEQEAAPELSAGEIHQLKNNSAVWSFFQAQAPSYRKRVVWWVVSAKRADTRRRRLGLAMDAFAAGRRL